jgi:uncharacterized protein YbcI
MGQASGRGEPPGRFDLTEICNTAVRLHRDHFGRGPGAAKAYVEQDLLVCVLTDVLTPPERALVAAGLGDKVLEWRSLHQELVGPAYCKRMAEVIERPIKLFTSSLHLEEECAIDSYLLDGSGGAGR